MKTRLREIRDINKFTQEEFSKTLNLSQRTYESYEREERPLPIDVAIQISKLYDVSLDWIFYQSDQKNQLDSITKTLVALRKVFKVVHQNTRYGHDVVLLIDSRFRDFIDSMNTLLIEYGNHPKITERLFVDKLESMEGFVLDNQFFFLLGLEDMKTKERERNNKWRV